MIRIPKKPVESLTPRSRRRRNKYIVKKIISKYRKQSQVPHKELQPTVSSAQPAEPTIAVAQNTSLEVETCSEPRRTKVNRCLFGSLPVEVDNEAIEEDNEAIEEDNEAIEEDNEAIEEDIEATGTNFLEEIKLWTLKHNCTRSQVSDLLKILKTHSCFQDLPSDSRSLFRKDTVALQYQPIDNGQLIYLGIQRASARLEPFVTEVTQLSLQVNIDGLPLHKSGSTQFWPILGSFTCFPRYVFVVALFCGKAKPSTLENYLAPFVTEAKVLEENGLLLNGVNVPFNFNSLVCDAPARAYVMGTKSHSGFYACGKCELRGKTADNRVVFTKLDANLRTNETFRTRSQSKHHVCDSPLEQLQIDMVRDVPLDYMHLVCIGANKKLVKNWTDGKWRSFRLSPREKERISQDLLRVSKFLPAEFVRKGRSLQELDRWKATEQRTFLLYTGPVILFGKLDKKYYENFMLLSVATRILCKPAQSELIITYAENLLRLFVQQCKDLYGRVFISYNIHSLIHLANDYRKFGPLDNFSAFKYESFLGKLKALAKSTRFPLQHAVNEINKREHSDIEPILADRRSVKKKPAGCSGEFSSIALQSKKITVLSPDNVLRLTDSKIVTVNKIFEKDGELHLSVKHYLEKENLFKYPCESSRLGIFKVGRKQSEQFQIPIVEVQDKCISIEIGNNFAILPIIHED